MKKINRKVETFRSGSWTVEIVSYVSSKNGIMFEAWLQRDGYGIKDLMFGCPQKQPGCVYGDTTHEDFIDMVESELPKYKKIYTAVY